MSLSQLQKESQLSNPQLASKLKKEYNINKNITSSLSREQKQEILELIESNESVLTLVQSFVSKNEELRSYNRRSSKIAPVETVEEKPEKAEIVKRPEVNIRPKMLEVRLRAINDSNLETSLAKSVNFPTHLL